MSSGARSCDAESGFACSVHVYMQRNPAPQSVWYNHVRHHSFPASCSAATIGLLGKDIELKYFGKISGYNYVLGPQKKDCTVGFHADRSVV